MRSNQQQAGALMVEKMMQQYGCLPSAPDGPVIARFDALELAQALESEMERSAIYGWSKMTIHMDMIDARALAAFLRQHHG